MIDVTRMSPDELVAEAARRADRRAAGKSLEPDAVEVAARREEEDERLEKEIQRDVRKRYIAFGCRVYNLSQARASKQSPGLSDLVVFHRRTRIAWWHETKTMTGEQSPAQEDFERNCIACGWLYVKGGVQAAEEQLIKIGAGYRLSDGSLEPRH